MKNVFINGQYEAIDGEIEYNLGMCYSAINEWQRFKMRKNSKHKCLVQLRCYMPDIDPDCWKLYLELHVNNKMICQYRIMQEAYDVLARDKPTSQYGNVEFVEYLTFHPVKK